MPAMAITDSIREKLASALVSTGVTVAPEDLSLELPGDISHGDYASGVALKYAKQAGKNPRALAEALVAHMGAIDGISSVEIAGPGFINFKIAPAVLWEHLKIGRENGEEWGGSSLNKGKKILVEYTDPNPFKVFHIGHLMSNTVGESIARLLHFSAAEIQRANYQGDVGPHVAKAIWGVQKLALDPSSVEDLGRAYVEGAHAYEESVDAKAEMDVINAKVYDRSDAEINAIYDIGRATSLAHFEELYALLGTKFDHYFFESVTAPRGAALVKAHPDVFEESDGAVVYKGEKAGLHTRVFLTSKGLPTYETKDLGLAELKAETWNFDSSITITAQEQAEYFKVVLAAMHEVLPDIAPKIRHVTHGMMRFADGKMSSRTGNVVTGESLITDLIAVAKERAEESRAEDKEQLARDVAVAAIKFQILKGGTGKDIIFDRERALSVEGDSGPYLQYAHARTCAILEKAAGESIVPQFDMNALPTDLVRIVYRFHENVKKAQEELEPHIVATYLISLASAFNSWYAQEQILDGTDQAQHKLAIVDIVRQTLENGIWVLGIPTPKKM